MSETFRVVEETPYLWEAPKKIHERLKTLIEFIEKTPAGGSGLIAKEEILTSIKSWFDRIEYYCCDKEEWEEAKKIIATICTLDKYLPTPILRMIERDVGLKTLVRIAAGCKTFWLCDDCRTPLYFPEDARDGCYYCGDNMSQNKEHRIVLK